MKTRFSTNVLTLIAREMSMPVIEVTENKVVIETKVFEAVKEFEAIATLNGFVVSRSMRNGNAVTTYNVFNNDITTLGELEKQNKI